MRHVIVGVMVIGLLASAVFADYGVNQAIEDVASASFVGEEEQDAAGTVVAPAGDVDGDGDFDRIESFGARSISVWERNSTSSKTVGSGQNVTVVPRFFDDATFCSLPCGTPPFA